MRLRLNTTLRAALIAAITAVGFTLTQAQAAAPQTIGQTLTWDAGNADASAGKYVMTTFDQEGAVTYGTTYQGWNQQGMQQFFYNQTNRNTLRFGSDKGAGVKSIKYTFNNFTVGGFLVDTGATDFDIHTDGGNDRSFFLGTTVSGATAYTTIKEDFTLKQTSGNANSIIHLQGSEVFDVETDNVFHVQQSNNNKLDFDTQLVVKGGGTVAFDGTSTVAMTAGSSLEIQSGSTVTFSAAVTGLSHTITNAGTVNFGGAVSVADFSGFKGTAEYSNEGNGFIIAGKYTLVEGAGTVTGLTQISHGGSTLDVDQTDYTVSVTDADYTAYYLNTANASVVVDDAAAAAQDKGQTLTTVNVKNTGTTVTVNSVQALDTLSIAEGMGTTVNGTGTLAVNSNVAIGNGGSLAIASGSTLKVANAASAKALMMGTAVTNDGTFMLASNVSFANGESTQMGGTLAIQGATVTLGTGEGTTASIESFSHVNLDGGQITVNAQNATIKGVSVAADKTGTVKVEDMKNSPNTVKLAGITQVDGTLNLTNNWNSSFTIDRLAGSGTLSQAAGGQQEMLLTINSLEGFTGNLSLKHNKNNDAISINTGTAAVSFNSLDLDIGSHSANITTAADTTIGALTVTSGTANFTGEGSLNVGALDGAGTVSVQGITLNVADGTHAFTGSFSATGQLVKTGEGSQAISGYVMSRAMDVQAGTLVLNGTYSIDGITDGDVITKYFDDKGVESSNGGFKEMSGTKTVYSIKGDAIVNTDNAHFTYGGSDVTDEVKVGGTYVIPSSGPDYTTLHVIDGELSLAPYQQKSQDVGSSISNIVITADAKLVADNDYTGALSVIGEGTGLLEILSSNVVSLSSQDQDLELSGQGTYALGEGTTSMGNVTLGDDWSGTVKVTGTINNIDLNNYGQAGSKVEMNGVSGYFLQAANKEFTPELVLNGDGLTLTDGFSTMPDKQTYTGFVFDGGVSGEGDMTFNKSSGNVTQHLYFTGDIFDWQGALNVKGGFTVYAQYSGEDQVVNSSIHRTGGTLNVEVGTGSAADVVTFNRDITADSFTVMEEATANVKADLTATTITVNADGTMNMTDGTLSTAITNNGTVSLTDITLNADGFEEQGGDTAYFDLTGVKVEETDNHYLGADETYVQVVNGGTVSGSGISWKDGTYKLEDDGRIVVNQEGADYGTFFVVDEINASAIAAGLHYADTQTIDVGDMATLNIDTALAGKTIVTHEYSYITGAEATPEAISLAAGGSTFFSENVTTADGITFSSNIMGVAMANTNEDGAPVQYSTAAESIVVQASEMTNNSDTDVTVANKVDVSSIENNGTGKLILTNVYLGDEASLASIAANTGDITLQNVGANPVELENLTIAVGQTVAVYQGDEIAPNNEGTVTISDTLTGGDATLLANLTLVGGSTLDVDGGGTHALTLGSMLTVDYASGLINLDEETIAALNGLADGASLALIKAGQVDLEYAENYNGIGYDNMFVRANGLAGDYTVYADNGAFGLTKQGAVPEPTTGTLSLLALAALAARRRRK